MERQIIFGGALMKGTKLNISSESLPSRKSEKNSPTDDRYDRSISPEESKSQDLKAEHENADEKKKQEKEDRERKLKQEERDKMSREQKLAAVRKEIELRFQEKELKRI